MNNRKMKHKTKRTEWGITALTAVVLTSAVGVPVVGNDAQDPALTKSETVYVLTDAQGNSREIIVGEWLKNTAGLELLNDWSELENIQNMEGEETFSQDGETLIWNADGSDIHYQGTSEKELPVSIHITYYLDGAEIAPEDLAGKSGKVTIRCEYTNLESRAGENGEEIYVPFTVLSGMIFSENCVKNVEVSSGKVITQDDMTVVVGIAFPGLKESLALEQDEERDFQIDMDIPEYVEITMDAEKFEMDMSASMILSDMFGSLDLDSDDDWQELKDAMEELSDGSQELVDGSQELADGVGELQEKVPELTDGAQELQDGVSEYTDGVATVYSGVNELQSGSSTLTEKSKELTRGAGQLNKGADSLASGMSTLETGIGSFSDGAETMTDGIDELQSGAGQLLAGLQNVSQALQQLQESLMGDETDKGQIEELKNALTQISMAVGSETQGAQSIHNCYEKIAEDVNLLYQFYSGDHGIGENSVQTAAENAKAGNTVSDETQIQSLKEEAAALKSTAQSSAEKASELAETGQGTMTAAQNAEEAANGLYQEAVNAYEPLIHNIEETLNAVGLSKYAGYAEDGQNTAQAVADGYQSATGNYENAVSGYQESANEYLAAVEAYEQTIADYEAIIAQYENMLSEEKMETAAVYSEENSETKAKISETEATDIWMDLFTNIRILGIIEGGDGQETLGVTASIQNLQESLVGENGAFNQLVSALGQMSAGVGTPDTTDTTTLVGGVKALETGLTDLENGTQNLLQGVNSLTGGVQSLSTGAEELSKGSGDLKSGITAFTSGVSKVDQGISKLQSGVSELDGNSSKLNSGAEDLHEGTLELADGVDELKEGADELKDGMEELHEDGIQKLKEMVVDDMDQLIERLQAVQKAGDDYQSFAGIADDMSGDVKFIIKTDGILVNP